MTLHLKGLTTVIIAGSLLTPTKMFSAARNKMLSNGPTAQNALAADQQLARALQNNDTAGVYRMLDKDWAVVTGFGDVAEGPGLLPSGIRSGHRTLTLMELSEPRVHLFGNIALVTTKVRLTGIFGGKSFDVKERQTDVLRWKDGEWKCILTQESMVKE